MLILGAVHEFCAMFAAVESAVKLSEGGPVLLVWSIHIYPLIMTHFIIPSS